jgi:hypothetical protein
MTIERPMFPPRAAKCSSAEINPFATATVIQFSSGAPGVHRDRQKKRHQRAVTQFSPPKALPAGGVSADIGLNERLRIDRRTAWYAASAAADIWRGRMRMLDEIRNAQRYQLPEVQGLPPAEEGDRMRMLERYRRATVVQLLTPAPDMASVIWKRRVVDLFNPWDWMGATPERVERAISDDEAFLKAHPTRHCRHRPAKAPAAEIVEDGSEQHS